MFAPNRWTGLMAATLALTLAATTQADDTFVQQGVVVKPLPKWKQRQLEKKLLRNPGNKVVIEGAPTVTPSPEAIAGVKSRRSLRPIFGDRFGKRNDVVVTAPRTVVAAPRTVITGPATIVSPPRTVIAPGDPLVVPGSVEVTPGSRVVRPPVISTPRGQAQPVEPMEPELEPERPATVRILPPPAEEIPAPVVSIPRRPSTPAPMSLPSPTPVPSTPTPAPAVPADPGPPATPPAGPELELPVQPPLESPLEPKPA